MHLRQRLELGEFLNQSELVGCGVEVGVADAAFSRAILRTWTGRRLFLIDGWAPQSALDYCDIANRDAAAHETNLRKATALAQENARVELRREFSPAAAAHFDDASLDFVYLDANHSYLAVRADLLAWYPKVRPGGLLAGHDYLDGYAAYDPDSGAGTLFGVKFAVDEFAREIGQAVAFTVDDPPFVSWYFRKRPPRSGGCVTLLTACDPACAAIGDISRANKERYCGRHGHTFRSRSDGFDRSRPPAWSKGRFLLEELPACDWAFWTDADSLVMNGAVPLTWFLDDSCDVILASDHAGCLSTGAFFVRNSPWACSFLETVYRQAPGIDHLHGDAAAIAAQYTADAEVRRHVAVVPNKLFNGCLSDGSFAHGDFMVHFAGLPDRPVLMRNYAAMAR